MQIDDPVTRPLKAYAFDPSAGKLLGNEMTMHVRYQKLEPGPIVAEDTKDAIAVIDYNGATGKYYEPVNLDDPRILIRGGLDPSEGDPQFHQQMVYAVVSDTIQHFETALGRRIHWRRGLRDGDVQAARRENIWTLNLYPHAFVGQNAFYSPQAKGILFGYFRASGKTVGRNLPGQTVFTCLSHDIIVHETTHAIVDGIRACFMEQTNPDVPAFHEAFADLAALFRHFTHKEVLLDTIERTGGRLYQYQLKPDAETTGFDDYADATEEERSGVKLSAQISHRNPLIELAQQFGEATGRNRALRSALGTKPNSDAILNVTEPHLRGSILVAAVFDAYFAIYLKRTADLWRIFRAGGGNANPVDIPCALAGRLADEATRLAEEFFTICVRALDYCPPVDITFGAYLRAVLTADFDLHPDDAIGMRDALMQSFRLRGIMPEGAEFFSETSICWPRASDDLPTVDGLEFGDPNGLTNAQKDKVGDVLRAYLKQNGKRLNFHDGAPILIPSFHPVFRINPDGSLRTDMVVEAVQSQQVPFNKDAPQFGSFPLRGGATLIIRKPVAGEKGAEENKAPLRYVISRHLSEDRADRQRRFGEHLGIAGSTAARRFDVNFAMVHGGL
ncbi:MAG TPA: peptidase M4 [Thermoanaerobaculia bacterium]|nr:peptidase M4 [Thermoanaerobaculia bacterium]